MFWNKKQGANTKMEEKDLSTVVKECPECKKEKPIYKLDMCLECNEEFFK
jgi:hypothetical protein